MIDTEALEELEELAQTLTKALDYGQASDIQSAAVALAMAVLEAIDELRA